MLEAYFFFPNVFGNFFFFFICLFLGISFLCYLPIRLICTSPIRPCERARFHSFSLIHIFCNNTNTTYATSISKKKSTNMYVLYLIRDSSHCSSDRAHNYQEYKLAGTTTPSAIIKPTANYSQSPPLSLSSFSPFSSPSTTSTSLPISTSTPTLRPKPDSKPHKAQHTTPTAPGFHV